MNNDIPENWTPLGWARHTPTGTEYRIGDTIDRGDHFNERARFSVIKQLFSTPRGWVVARVEYPDGVPGTLGLHCGSDPAKSWEVDQDIKYERGDTPTITAIAPWFGSKRTIAPRIVTELGEHRAYWEPFCGSMAVLLAKPQATMETVNDLHGDLVNLARVVQHPTLGPALYRRLRRVWMSEVLHREATERWRERGNTPTDQPDIDRAADYMLCAWLGRNGVAGTQSYNQGFCVRYTKNGGHGATRWRRAVDSIPAWRRRLRAVTILNRDGFDLLADIEDAAGVVIYCDPPYLVKGAKYVHDFKPEDHRRLANLLMRFTKTRVVVSYYDHPDLAALYPGWTVVHCPTTKVLVNQGMRDKEGGTVAPEVLLINGPSLTDESATTLSAAAPVPAKRPAPPLKAAKEVGLWT